MTIQSAKTLHLPCPAQNLIIHRPPMLLIDSLLERYGDDASASAEIDKNNLCYSDEHGILPEYFIEIMAQTMAAANGYDAIMADSSPKDGFIVGLDNFSLNHQETAKGIGSFTVNITKTLEFGSMKVMAGKVFRGTTLVASGELKVWERESDNN